MDPDEVLLPLDTGGQTRVALDQVRGGWCMGETVLRYAQVRVAAALEAEETTETEEEPSDGGE